MNGMKQKRILMLLENYFPQDVRVRQEAYTLVENGYQVSVIAQYFSGKEPFHEIVNGVDVYRLPSINLFTKGKRSKHKFLNSIYLTLAFTAWILEYIYFTVACFLLSLYVWMTKGFHIIHHHNPPNTVWLIALFYKIIGKKYVFDQHDLSPQLFASKFKRKGLIYWMLVLEEKCCLYFADMIIATNESYKTNDLNYSFVEEEKIFIVRNGPNLDKLKLMDPDPEIKSMGKTIIAYLGVMGPQDGVDYLLRSLRDLVNQLGRSDFYCLIIGPGDSLANLKKYATELGLADYIKFTGYLPYKDWIPFLSATDICLEPSPSSPFNDVSTTVKVLEYMALKKPIVSFDLVETRFSAQEASVYAKPNDETAFAVEISKLMDSPEKRAAMGEIGYARIKDHLSWFHVSQPLLEGYEQLLNTK